jgi:glycosyltransferase involved in cell wall biosynthesis
MTSPSVGGPERLVLGLASCMSPFDRFVFFLFADGGRSGAFERELSKRGLEATVLLNDTPYMRAMVRELGQRIDGAGIDVLCCHGYKASMVGLLAARRASVPVIAMSHGWTAESWKVRAYELLDRVCLRRMDAVVCVSQGQAERVLRAGVRSDRVTIVRNAIQSERFDRVDPGARGALLAMFPVRPERIIGSAGRLSPEKGFGVFVEAAAIVARSMPGAGFIHFGDGPLRKRMERRIRELGLESQFVVAGHRDDLGRFLPHWHLTVLPSFTEGLPTIVLESYAAGVPVVATAVGGTPEAVVEGVDGWLVPPGNPDVLARRVLDALHDDDRRREMGRLGRERIQAEFNFDRQAARFRACCDSVVAKSRALITS